MLVEDVSPARRMPVLVSGQDFWNPVIDRPVVVSHSGIDFWLPAQAPEVSQAAIVDFWLDFGGRQQETTRDEVAEPSDDGLFALPWFDPHLAVIPPSPPLELSTRETWARRRARWLVQLLDLTSWAQRKSSREYFEELFTEFGSQNTFRALAALAIDDASADTLISACEFRRNAVAHPYLLARGPHASYRPIITWARAYRFIGLVAGDDPFDHLENDWYGEWQMLPRDDLRSWCFIDFVEDRLRAKALGYWNLGEIPLFADAATSGPTDMPDWRSTAGRLAFASTGSIGVLYPESSALIRFAGSSRFGSADSRLLD